MLAAALSVAILVASRVRVPLWRDPWFILSAIVAGAAFVLLVVSGIPDLAGWLHRQVRMAPSVVITSPEADQRVPQKVTARGSAARIPDKMTLWLIVQSQQRFYPQAKIHLPTSGTSRWAQQVNFGARESVSHEYTLWAIGADPAANSRLEIYLQQKAVNNDTPPLTEAKGTLPKIARYAAVNVIRGL